jgi:hypothetical protein
MRRTAFLLSLLALTVGATALAQAGGQDGGEPDVTSREVFDLPGGCRPAEGRVTVRIDPSGAVLASMRVHVAGLEVVRMTGIEGPASATVRIGREPTRVTATADTLGGQALYLTRIYGRCAPPAPIGGQRPVIGGGED